MTGSRGEHIRRARDLRRESRDDVAAATGVNPKTIARIERGEVQNSPNIAILEHHLGITPPADPTTLDRAAVLRTADDLELIAELARRLADRRGHETDTTGRLGPEGEWRWPTAAAPYPEPGTATTSKDDVADGR